MKLVKKIKEVWLGGTGKMYNVCDNNGNYYLYKAAEARNYPHTPLPYRAHVCVFASFVQSIVDSQSAVPVELAECEGYLGYVQPRYKTDDRVIDTIIDWQGYDCEPMTSFFKDKTNLVANQLLREFVTDYLLNNFDSHPRNFIYDRKERVIRGIDKEQAFKYYRDPRAKKPSLTYAPNAKYGEMPPVYNKLFTEYKKGELDLDLDYLNEIVERVEAVDDKIYMSKCRDYIEVLYEDEEDRKELYDFILERKTNIRENVLGFVKGLKKDRLPEGR